MRLSVICVLAGVASLMVWAQQASPRMISVDPPSGKQGDLIAVTGENLQKDQVAKVVLTDGKNDTPVEVTEQTATTIKFKIPEKIHAGRVSLLILTGGAAPQYLEEPVKIEIQQ